MIEIREREMKCFFFLVRLGSPVLFANSTTFRRRPMDTADSDSLGMRGNAGERECVGGHGWAPRQGSTADQITSTLERSNDSQWRHGSFPFVSCVCLFLSLQRLRLETRLSVSRDCRELVFIPEHHRRQPAETPDMTLKCGVSPRGCLF